MQCPLCSYELSDFDAVCPKCKGKGVSKPAVITTPTPHAAPYNPTIPRPAPIVERKGTSPLLIAGLLLVPVIGAFGFLKFSGMGLRPKDAAPVATPIAAMAPPAAGTGTAASPVAVPTLAPSNSQQSFTRADQAYIENMDKVFNMIGASSTKGLSTGATLSVLQGEVRQAQTQMLEAPPTARFAKAHSLMRDGLSEMSLGITMTKLGADTKSQKMLDEAQVHIDNSSEIREQAFNEFDKIARDLRGK